jgi:hypothetical protein
LPCHCDIDRSLDRASVADRLINAPYCCVVLCLERGDPDTDAAIPRASRYHVHLHQVQVHQSTLLSIQRPACDCQAPTSWQVQVDAKHTAQRSIGQPRLGRRYRVIQEAFLLPNGSCTLTPHLDTPQVYHLLWKWCT